MSKPRRPAAVQTSVLQAARELRLGVPPVFEPGDPYSHVVSLWRALVQSPKDAALRAAFVSACDHISVSSGSVERIAEWVHFLASRDGIAGGHSIAMSVKASRKRSRVQTQHKAEALRLYDAQLGAGVGVMKARQSVSSSLREMFGNEGPSTSAIRDWVKERDTAG